MVRGIEWRTDVPLKMADARDDAGCGCRMEALAWARDIAQPRTPLRETRHCLANGGKWAQCTKTE